MKVQGPWMSMGMPTKSKSTKGKTPISFLAEFVVVLVVFLLEGSMDVFLCFLVLEFESQPTLNEKNARCYLVCFLRKGMSYGSSSQTFSTFACFFPPNSPWKETSAAS